MCTNKLSVSADELHLTNMSQNLLHGVQEGLGKQKFAGACGLLFPCLKSIMKGARFADMAAIQECVTVVL
jgi:hypothetical protein